MENESLKNLQCEDVISQPEKKDPSGNVHSDEPKVLNECPRWASFIQLYNFQVFNKVQLYLFILCYKTEMGCPCLGGQWTTFGSRFSPSTVPSWPGNGTLVIRLRRKRLPPEPPHWPHRNKLNGLSVCHLLWLTVWTVLERRLSCSHCLLFLQMGQAWFPAPYHLAHNWLQLQF